MDDYERICMCALGRVFGFEPGKALSLIKHAGSARIIFESGRKELEVLMGPYSRYLNAINKEILDDCARELERLKAQGYNYITIEEKAYPKLLKECEDAPIGLYIRATSSIETLFNNGAYVSIVGTRDLSLYGKEWCRRVVAALAKARSKPVIVSGLALGTDVTAHEAALEGGLRTIGVLPTGIEDVYPRRHESIARKICDTEGCGLITDYPPGTCAMAINFLRRNRIIAGLSSATILIESKVKGGGMITARIAFSYNRDVYALPGRIDDWNSQGCNRLLQQKIAEPITELDSLVDSLGLGRDSYTRKDRLAEDVAATYRGYLSRTDVDRIIKVATYIREHRGIDCENLATELGFSYSEISSCLSLLESDGIITVDLLRRCSINIRVEP